MVDRFLREKVAYEAKGIVYQRLRTKRRVYRDIPTLDLRQFHILYPFNEHCIHVHEDGESTERKEGRCGESTRRQQVGLTLGEKKDSYVEEKNTVC